MHIALRVAIFTFSILTVFLTLVFFLMFQAEGVTFSHAIQLGLVQGVIGALIGMVIVGIGVYLYVHYRSPNSEKLPYLHPSERLSQAVRHFHLDEGILFDIIVSTLKNYFKPNYMVIDHTHKHITLNHKKSTVNILIEPVSSYSSLLEVQGTLDPKVEADIYLKILEYEKKLIDTKV